MCTRCGSCASRQVMFQCPLARLAVTSNLAVFAQALLPSCGEEGEKCLREGAPRPERASRLYLCFLRLHKCKLRSVPRPSSSTPKVQRFQPSQCTSAHLHFLFPGSSARVELAAARLSVNAVWMQPESCESVRVRVSCGLRTASGPGHCRRPLGMPARRVLLAGHGVRSCPA